MNQLNLFLSLFNVGDTVEAHPACDCWMAGDRFGKVTKSGTKYVHVQMFVSGKIRRFAPENLLPKGEK